MSKQKLVIVGNGMAPGRMLEHLFEIDRDAFDVTIFNAEPRVNYDRIMLSPVLSGEKSFADIVIHDDAWYADNGITLHRGQKVTGIDRAAKTVTAAGGETACYDKLVIATGSDPFIIPVPGHQLSGVLAYRDLDDVEKMKAAAAKGGRAVVIGGGLLGLEAAAGLKAQGMEVTVLHLMPTLLERQLDPAAGYLLQKELEGRGIDIRCQSNTKQILGRDAVEGVELEDGTLIDASIVVMAVGIRPNVTLAKEAGLTVERGIVTDAAMRTSDPDILSVGECVQVDGRVYGLVAPLYQMARVAAQTLTGTDASFAHTETPTKLKVTGINLYSVGQFDEGPGYEDVVLRDAARGSYKRVILKENRVIGAVLYGDVADGAWYNEMLKSGEDVSDRRDTLIFGQNHQGGGAIDPLAAVANLSDDAEICGCNGICKGQIVNAITEKSLTSLADVRAHTKASASCGTCTNLVENLMALTLGDAVVATPEGMCDCTHHTHGDVRRLIRAMGLKSIPAVMQALEWTTPEGCAKCRPALNYYLVADWPGEYVDHQQSRFINERVHANIQKDGTYSVVPRMFGGLTTPSELRAIADVAEKYDIPTVKVTGGQRIDLLGVKKEDLLPVWKDLNDAGMISGAAYSKGLRTVKTCVGKDWCRFGTQDSMGLGIKLEKYLWGAWSPAKLKLAVTGCPRNCAEATCKDIGVICVDSGFQIVYGGAAGLHIQGTTELGTVRTEEEVMEVIGALTQYYRESGFYLERIYKWADRVGYDHIKSVVLDDIEERKALAERFAYSQTFAQFDPWAARVAGEDAHEFKPLAVIDAPSDAKSTTVMEPAE
ncbi:nitrite reductase large subunit NirB [Maritimibacter sp. DP1N21-5]|uniref:nitrite reductase large subunit NirB n=1 Tax=Maritimibacter sp. DP1N21-5 TaxID=2836867 RepID=UPI001C486E72|nr:nitrite reductase large subunit NirB [Maritimibacter sp. DP1N21-5]MBV7410592.1 nitrite reductase large subunit NirB [Maritimibacter sp. DP1N21-5]